MTNLTVWVDATVRSPRTPQRYQKFGRSEQVLRSFSSDQLINFPLGASQDVWVKYHRESKILKYRRFIIVSNLLLASFAISWNLTQVANREGT